MRDYEHKSEIAELRARNADLERQLADMFEKYVLASQQAIREGERAEQAEQRIAESRRQKPAAWMAHIPQVGGTYSVHLQEEKHHPLGVAWEEPLYAAHIVPPDVEEAVKAERDACAKICEHLIEPNEAEGEWPDGYDTGCEECAEAIRARSGK